MPVRLLPVVPLAAPVALRLRREVAAADSPHLAAPRRNDLDRPLSLGGTPWAPLSTAGSMPTPPTGSIDTRTRRRYTRADAGLWVDVAGRPLS
jgi:hypothetical protein